MAGRDEEWRPRQRLPEKGPHFPDDPIWVTLSEPRPGRIEALAERFSGRALRGEGARPRVRARLSEVEVVALTA